MKVKVNDHLAYYEGVCGFKVVSVDYSKPDQTNVAFEYTLDNLTKHLISVEVFTIICLLTRIVPTSVEFQKEPKLMLVTFKCK